MQKSISIALSASLLVCNSSFAEDDAASWRNQRPEVPEARAPTLPVFQKTVLKNGLTLLLSEVNAVPVVSFNLVSKGGATYDPRTKAGLTSLTYELLEEGAGALDALAFSDAVADLGAGFSAGGGRDSGSVTISGLSRQADGMMKLLADAVMRPRLDAASFERRKQQLIATLVSQRGSPQGLAFEKVPALIYGADHPFGHPPSGTLESVQTLTHADVQAHYKAIFGPKHSALIVAGDMSLEQAKALAETYLGSWNTEALTPPTIPAVQAHVRTEVRLVNKAGAAQTMMIVGRPVFEKGHPDEDALTLANLIFGGTFASRLNMNLREAKGYTYGASSQAAFRNGVGVVLAYSALRADVTGAGLKETIDELARMKSQPATAEELSAARFGLVRSLPGKFEVASAMAGAAEGLFVYDMPLDHFSTLAARYNQVSLEAVQKAAETYLDPSPMQILLVGDAAQVAPQLEGLGYGKLVTE